MNDKPQTMDGALEAQSAIIKLRDIEIANLRRELEEVRMLLRDFLMLYEPKGEAGFELRAKTEAKLRRKHE